MPGKHSRVSASRVPALALCPGMLHAEEKIRSKPGYAEISSIYATQGTRRHTLLEWRQAHPSAPWPTQIEEEQITSDDVLAVETIAPYFLDHPARNDKTCGVWHVEKNVEIGQWIGMDPGIFKGTIDGLFVSKHELEIVDAKFGSTIVSPESWQLKSYAVGAGSLVDWGGKHRGIDNTHGRVKLTIAQPTNAESPITSVEYGINKIEEWGKELKVITDKALVSKAPRIPGILQCRFCLAKGSCRERMEWVAHEQTEMFDDLTAKLSGDETSVIANDQGVGTTPPPVATVDTLAAITDNKLTQDPHELSDRELGRLLDQAKLLEGFIKDAREELSHRLQVGKGRDSGWKMIAGRKKREWAVDDATVEKTLRGCGLKVGEIYPKTLPSVAQMEAKVKIKGKKQFEKMSAIFKISDGKPVLAPEGDPNPSVFEDMFQDISQQPVETETPSWLD